MNATSANATVRPPPPFTVAEALEYLKISRPTLYMLVRENRVTILKIGRSSRIPAADIYGLAGVEQDA
jgi:excisionase family DNA binding protein